MINTDKSIIKNFKECCLKDGEELVYNYLCKSSKLKKMFVLAYTNQKRFLMGSAKLFGKMVLLDEFVASDVKSIEMGIKTGLAANYFIKISYKDKEDVFKSQMINPSDILKQIYEQAPNSKPSYLKEANYLESLAVKPDLHFLLSSQKLLIIDFDETNVSVKQEIDYSKITDFDIYSQKIGTFKNFYLEIDSKPELYLIDIIRTDEDYVNYLSSIFRLTNIVKPVPAHMEDDEQEIVTFNLTKSMGVGLGNKKMRVASKNVYLLEKNKDGKLVPYDKISISNISLIQADTFGTNLKAGSNNNHEIIIKTKDNKKINVWNTDEEIAAANIGINYIKQNIS